MRGRGPKRLQAMQDSSSLPRNSAYSSWYLDKAEVQVAVEVQVEEKVEVQVEVQVAGLEFEPH